ncbi:MAG: hypothetical protein WBD63_01025 [Phycisphaerae bacterium]|nr:hypothetical protein [Phycisphaerae bacterium]
MTGAIRASWMILTVMIGILVGCENTDPTKTKAVESTKEFLESHFLEEHLSLDGWAREPNRSYLMQRYEATKEFLASQLILEKPYVICATLGPLSCDPELVRKMIAAQEYILLIDALEYESHAVGIVLRDGDGDGKREWRFEVFGLQTTSPGWRLTLYRDWWVRCVLSEDPEPTFGQVPPKADLPPFSAPALSLPRHMLPSLTVFLYDEHGNLSNGVRIVTCALDSASPSNP